MSEIEIAIWEVISEEEIKMENRIENVSIFNGRIIEKNLLPYFEIKLHILFPFNLKNLHRE